ncbi:hypothetical protein K505DRAFT_69366 [Melanomma pulvis-pyrius CBS 109.77]|uniref:Uncharacterized protein n=1 Tax=Melanomma pulvis-pyrius CBS 109.77 TaxID=1314802 RepID=A0A6A6X4C0_9PLEO|nr:hypothetical protein K505DRAFT_69366 [Melanomma pulvis-pyrius CBS 109.77]
MDGWGPQTQRKHTQREEQGATPSRTGRCRTAYIRALQQQPAMYFCFSLLTLPDSQQLFGPPWTDSGGGVLVFGNNLRTRASQVRPSCISYVPPSCCGSSPLLLGMDMQHRGTEIVVPESTERAVLCVCVRVCYWRCSAFAPLHSLMPSSRRQQGSRMMCEPIERASRPGAGPDCVYRSVTASHLRMRTCIQLRTDTPQEPRLLNADMLRLRYIHTLRMSVSVSLNAQPSRTTSKSGAGSIIDSAVPHTRLSVLPPAV